MATDEAGVTIDAATGQPLPTPPRRRRPKFIKLATIGDIQGELARLYRQVRAGEVAPQDATRMGYLLNLLAGLIETHDLERRLEALEQQQLGGEL